MAILALKVLDKDSNTICVSSGEDFVDLVCTHTYEEGDRIVLETDEKNIHVHLQVDDALGDAFVYITDNVSYYVPFGEKRISMSPKVFSGNKHYLYAEVAREDEITVYRNLALNPADQHMDVPCYPHATANVETRGESVFAAKNAIDGVRANRSHGEWPYESWGINMQDDAAMKLDFGRPVLADRIVLYTRSDFPHDNWWQQVTIRFSDGSVRQGKTLGGAQIMKSAHKKAVLGKVIVYAILILIAAVMIIPFLWMLSASIKSDREVFQMNPFVWIPANPRWDNYLKIWTKIPFGRFVGNTVYLTLIVTFLQLLTSSFAAYSFAKLDFRHKNGLFLAYIATIAMPWQVYMVPQFIMMRRMGLNDKLLAMICLQAFSAFGVFMMKQFYEGIPDDLCEAARIDGMSEYRIYASIMLPLSKPALSTLTIFTFVATWNDYLGPLIYLKSQEKKTIQLGLKMFISQYSSDYGLIMAGSVLSLIPVLIVFLVLQKYFVEGVASTGLKG